MLKRLSAACIVALGLILAPDAVRFVWASCEAILAVDPTKVNTSGDTMTGTLTMDGAPINLTGAGGTITSQSSVTASAFFGNGAALTGIQAGPGYFGAEVILSSHVATAAIQTAKLDTDAVTAVKILAGAVQTSKIGADAVTASSIRAGSVETTHLADGIITPQKVAASAVQTAKLASDAVTAAKIISGAVETSKIADGAVTAQKVADAAIQTAKLGTDSVTAAKLIASDSSLPKITSGQIRYDSTNNVLATWTSAPTNGQHQTCIGRSHVCNGNDTVALGGAGNSKGTGSVTLGWNNQAGTVGGDYYAIAAGGTGHNSSGFYTGCFAGLNCVNAGYAVAALGGEGLTSGSSSRWGLLSGYNSRLGNFDYVTAMGYRAFADKDGSFVVNQSWDDGITRFSSGPYSITMHARGGFFFAQEHGSSKSTFTFNYGNASIPGTMTAGTFSGSGASLTNIPAAALASGSVETAKLGTDSVTAVKISGGAVETSKIVAGVTLRGVTVQGPSTLTNGTTQAILSGGSAQGGVSTFGGSLQLGSSVGFSARIDHDGVNGILEIANMQDSASDQTKITLRGNTPASRVTPMTWKGDGFTYLGSGSTTIYRCTSAGTLPTGALTSVSSDCGSSVDTGLRTP